MDLHDYIFERPKNISSREEFSKFASDRAKKVNRAMDYYAAMVVPAMAVNGAAWLASAIFLAKCIYAADVSHEAATAAFTLTAFGGIGGWIGTAYAFRKFFVDPFSGLSIRLAGLKPPV
ncbi:hypothetical protein GGD81_004770 [Rhodobium orientis]|uniref:hypothetical protein n=1 Tax=Rhodobium orientis TaxID=34017 RepID=UPI0011B948DB|nr:hypothetical protein [Rhodobium orientis]MBB4305688.1 hypothetical protein [Rhodobium orientis]